MFRKTILLFLVFPVLASAGSQRLPLINQEHLEKRLFALAEYGKKENGETNRVAFSDADIAGRSYIMGLMYFYIH